MLIGLFFTRKQSFLSPADFLLPTKEALEIFLNDATQNDWIVSICYHSKKILMSIALGPLHSKKKEVLKYIN